MSVAAEDMQGDAASSAIEWSAGTRRQVRQRQCLELASTVCLKKTFPTFLAVTRESIVGFS